MDIERDFEAHAEFATQGSAERLADAVAKASFRARVARGKRRANAGFAAGLAVAAMVLVTAGSWATPRVFGEPAYPAPSPTPSASPPPYVHTPLDELPTDRDEGYVRPALGSLRQATTMSCTEM